MWLGRTVEVVGRNVTEFKPGDEVFGVARRFSCGIRVRRERRIGF